MEAINGWIKAELFSDFYVPGYERIGQDADDYISFFNEKRPAYSLNYLTPLQYRERYARMDLLIDSKPEAKYRDPKRSHRLRWLALDGFLRNDKLTLQTANVYLTC